LHFRLPFIKDFEFGRPQQWAALMLLALAAQSVWLARTPDFDPHANGMVLRALEMRFHLQPPTVTPPNVAEHSDSILVERVEEALMLSQDFLARLSHRPHLFALWFRIPFVAFGLWLGSALWWVSRRLYNNSGGYVALALYCSSPLILRMSSQINADIVAAWGLFGAVYTAIGVAHTLYAPAKKWPPRIVLLGVAFGVTASAYPGAFVLGLILAAVFMLYLAPGRRWVSVAILATATIIAALIFWAWYGFARDFNVNATLNFSADRFLDLWTNSPVPFLLFLAAALIIFLAWRRPKYFGNYCPLAVSLLLLACGQSFLWSLPFLFVFIGGVFADVFETGARESAAVAVAGLIVAEVVLTWLPGMRAR
jgi:hypothetical protein